MPASPRILIVGAGPTGLVLGLWLTRLGVGVRIIDKTSQAGTTSRALVLHARTLELYRQLGIVDDVVARALPFTNVNLWVAGRRAAHVELGAMGKGLTPYPEMLILPQDQHESLLLEHLARAGVYVERCTNLLTFQQKGDEVLARTRRLEEGERAASYAFVAGCDGARSTVRHELGIGFPGGTYGRVFFVADLVLRGPETDPDVDELHIALDDADFVGLFPLAGARAARLIGAVRPEALRHRDIARLTWADVGSRALDRLALHVDRVNWFSTYHVHHRVADHFRQGRVFLLGDAAHVHSPVGGQGMNTGIGDAANLAWKLAEVVRERVRDAETILASYETERIGFARRLVATTDRAFTLVSREGWLARRLRLDVVPAVLPNLARTQALRRYMFRVLSQTAITYRSSPLSRGHVGRVHGGDRLPWVADVDNFAPLRTLDWQVHVHGEANAELRRVTAVHALPLHERPYTADAEKARLERDAAYLVRPDGYVAVAASPGARAVDDYARERLNRSGGAAAGATG